MWHRLTCWYSQLLTLLVLLLPMSAYGGVMGVVSGRTADLHLYAPLSAELGLNELGKDFRWQTLRVNASINPHLIAYADIARLSTRHFPFSPRSSVQFSGSGFGAGFIYALNDSFSRYSFALQADYHQAILPGVQAQQTSAVSLKQNIVNAQLLVSPFDPLTSSGVIWYLLAGLTGMSFEVQGAGDQTRISPNVITGISAGLGLLQPLKYGEVFVSYENHARNGQLGIGVRINLR